VFTVEENKRQKTFSRITSMIYMIICMIFCLHSRWISSTSEVGQRLPYIISERKLS